MNNAGTKKLEEVNARLKRGEGWIGYRSSRNADGKNIRSKFLYYAFYQGTTQKFVNSKTNDPEAAYRALLNSHREVKEGNRVLPTDVSKMRYEDLKGILMEYYREHAPASLRLRDTGEVDSEGKKIMEETFDGADKLDEFFKRFTLPEITATKIQEYISGVKGRAIPALPSVAS